MPFNNVTPSQVTDMPTGRRSKPWMKSHSHGIFRMPLIQTMSVTDEQGVTIYDEFDNVDPVFSVREYNGVKTTSEYITSNSKTIEAVLMDVDPNASGPISYEGDQLAPVDLLVNETGKNSGTVISAKLFIYGQQSTSTNSADTKAGEKNSLGIDYLKLFRVRGGGGIQYTRFVDTPTYFTPADVAFVTGVGTYPSAAIAVPTTAGGTKIILFAYKNGNMVTDTTQYTATTTTFTPTVAPVSGDVWEVYTVTLTPSFV